MKVEKELEYEFDISTISFTIKIPELLAKTETDVWIYYKEDDYRFLILESYPVSLLFIVSFICVMILYYVIS